MNTPSAPAGSTGFPSLRAAHLLGRTLAVSWIGLLFAVCVIGWEPRALSVLLRLTPASSAAAATPAVNDPGLALIEAASTGELDAVQTALQRGADPDATTRRGATALISSAAAGHLQIVDLLLGHGATVDKPDRAGRTALLRAVARGNGSVVDRLLESGASTGVRSHSGATPLHVAAIGRTELLDRIVGASDERNPRDNAGRTPLHLAVKRGRAENVRLLVESGSEPNITDVWGYTPLMLAAAMKMHRPITILLGSGANPLATDIDGHTAFDHSLAAGDYQGFHAMAVYCGRLGLGRACGGFERVSRVLMTTEYDQRLFDLVQEEARKAEYEPVSYLHAAVSLGLHDLTLALLAAGAAPDVRNSEGLTPLHKAIERSRRQLAYHLIAAGADVNARVIGGRSRQGWTPLMMAASAGSAESVELLVANGAQLDARSHRGRTALFFAAADRRNPAAARLVAAGADTTLIDGLGLDAPTIRRIMGSAVDSGAAER